LFLAAAAASDICFQFFLSSSMAYSTSGQYFTVCPFCLQVLHSCVSKVGQITFPLLFFTL
jgi:hypothetical protein